MDSIIKGVNADVLQDVSTFGENRPTEGSNKDDKTKTKERRSKNKEDNYVNLDYITSDDGPVARALAPNVSRRLRQRKGKNVVNKVATTVMITERRSTPSTNTIAGPPKSWSKVEVKNKKRKNISKSEFEYDVEEDVQDITPRSKPAAKRRSAFAATTSSLDTVRFYPIENAVKWEFVNQRRIGLERDISSDVSKCK